MNFGAKTGRLIAAADLVIAGNDYLADWAAGHGGRDVRVIPSCVATEDYTAKTDWSIAGPPELIWLGSPASEHYVRDIAPALLEVHRRTGATLTLVSGPQDNPELASLRPMLRRVAWRPETFAAHLAAADIAIGPLDDGPYSLGKCAYKLLQYAATGCRWWVRPWGPTRRHWSASTGSPPARTPNGPTRWSR